MIYRSTRIGFFLLLIFLTSFLWLLPGVAGHLTYGDAGELALGGATLGIPHSPGYPLFALLNSVVSGLLMFGNEAYRQNLVSLLLLCFSLVLMGSFFIHLSGRPWTSLFSLFFLFSPQFRSLAHVTEVFPLTLFWAALIFFMTAYFYEKKEGLFLLAFLFGVGIGIHQTLVLLYPGVLYFYFRNFRDWKQIKLKTVGCVLLFFGLGLSVHFYLFFRSIAEPVLDWEDPETLSRFWGVITRERYGFFQLAQGEVERSFSLPTLGAVAVFTKNKIIENMGWVGAGIMLMGTLISLSRRDFRRWMIMCWITLFLPALFSSGFLKSKTSLLTPQFWIGFCWFLWRRGSLFWRWGFFCCGPQKFACIKL